MRDLANFSNARDGRSSHRRDPENRVRGTPDDGGPQAVARYLADMTAQLESMARASKLELLA